MTYQSSPFAAASSADGRTVRLAGDLEEQALPQLRTVLAPLLVGGGTLDLSDLTFLPSRAVGEVAVAQREALRAGAPLRLVAAPGTIAAAVLRAVAVEHEPA